MNEVKSNIPKLPHAFFKWYCRQDRYEEIHGDIEEFFYEHVEKGSLWKAKLLYILDVLRSFQPYAWKKLSITQNSKLMINKHIFIQVLRQFKKEKGYALFNITGLAIGLATITLVVLYAFNVTLFEKHHVKYPRIYKYGVNMTISGNSTTQSTCNYSVGPLLKEYMPGIEQYVRTNYEHRAPVVVHDKHFTQERLLWADPSIFEIFTYDITQGDVINCIRDPKNIAISESTARKYFGSNSAIGEIIQLKDIDSYTIAAVYKDQPENSYIRHNMILPLSKLLKINDEDGSPSVSKLSSNMGYELYFLFKDSFDTDSFYQAFNRFYDENFKETDIINYKAVVEPIHDIFLNSKIWESSADRNRETYYGFISVGLFILLLAAINYVNLSTARAESRAREIGIKKVIGANRIQLITQFLLESVFFSFVSLFVGLVIVYMILNHAPIAELLRIELNLNQILIPTVAFILVGLTLLIGVLSGIYPALFLSSIRPIIILNKTLKIRYNKFSFRNVLVIVQLVVSISAIILSMLMNGQIKSMINSDHGFDEENVLALEIKGESNKSKVVAFQNELNSHPNITSTSFSNTTPGFETMGYIFEWETEEGTMEATDAVEFYVDPEYYKTLSMEFVAGTNFKRRRQETDTTLGFIVNEKLVKKMGWTNPIGKRTSFGRVVGVVKDFNYGSYASDLRATYMIQYRPSRIPDLLNIKINDKDVEQTVAFIHNKSSEYFDDQVESVFFLDERMQNLYKSNSNQLLLNNLFSALCIVISCIGLIGLTAYVTSKRTKEIALRKVFGASEIQVLIKLFNGIFYKILFSAVIASFVGHHFFGLWQDNFRFRPPLDVSVFLLAFISTLIVAFLIAFYQARKIIVKNPSETLTCE